VQLSKVNACNENHYSPEKLVAEILNFEIYMHPQKNHVKLTCCAKANSQTTEMHIKIAKKLSIALKTIAVETKSIK